MKTLTNIEKKLTKSFLFKFYILLLFGIFDFLKSETEEEKNARKRAEMEQKKC